MNEFEQRIHLTEGTVPYMELKAAQLLVKNQLKVFQDMLSGDNHRIIWTNMVMPTEIFYAADLIPVQTELIAGWLSTLKLSSKYINTAHTKGYNVNLCSYHKTIIGALEAGVIPPPKVAVFSSHICDGGSLMARYLKDRFHTKVKLLDVPYTYSADSIKKVYNQLIKIKEFCEEYVSQEVSNQRIEQAVYQSNLEREYLSRVNELRKKEVVYCGNLAIRNMYGATFLLGSQLGVKVAKTYYEELKEKKPINQNGSRILWIHFAPLFHGRIMNYFEQELQCYIVFDITSYIYWSELSIDKPLVSISKKVLSHFFLGDVTARIRFYQRLAQEYSIDGIVMFMHQGCRAIPGSSWEIKEMSKASGIPFLELYGDCIDPGGFSEEQTKLRMEAFKEGLVSRRYVSRD